MDQTTPHIAPGVSAITASQTDSRPKEKFKFNFFDKNFKKDPYPFFKLLRDQQPLLKLVGPSNEWFITRYKDVQKILLSPDFRVDSLPQRLPLKNAFIPGDGNLNTLSDNIANWLFFLDPPDHPRLRSLLAKQFTPKESEKLQPIVAAEVKRIMDKHRGFGTMDIVRDFARTMPIFMACHILGIPEEDREKLLNWGNCLIEVFDQPNTVKKFSEMDTAAIEIKEYFSGLIIEKKRNPDDKIISHLLSINESDPDKLSVSELISTCTMMIAVGLETTETFLSNSILALLQHPVEFEWLKSNPDRIPEAIEELLRYDPPVQMAARMALNEYELHGETIKEGDRVLLSLGSSNRDPRMFDSPDILNLQRERPAHMAFGYGIHFCIGAHMARLQGKEIIKSLIELDHLEMALDNDQLEWYNNFFIRGLKQLPVTFQPKS